MQLARPACGDVVAIQRTHGHALYVNLTPPTSVRAHIAPARLSASSRLLGPISVHARIAPVAASFGAADTFASVSEQHIKKTERFLHILLLFERQRDRPINAKKTYPDGKSFSV
ncbi:MAG TPA: hypothetical protein VJ871_05400 [Bacteroidales bacterium]|nr:hypothetical protein [Bacteroidales bacterium]